MALNLPTYNYEDVKDEAFYSDRDLSFQCMNKGIPLPLPIEDEGFLQLEREYRTLLVRIANEGGTPSMAVMQQVRELRLLLSVYKGKGFTQINEIPQLS